jgi:uncharacterized membrane protein
VNAMDSKLERYVTRLETALAQLAPDERQQVLQDIRSHIVDSLDAGKPLDAVLGALGSADDLARAYRVELLLRNDPRQVMSLLERLGRYLQLAGLLLVGSVPTFMALVVFGTVGVTFVAVGIGVFVAGFLGPFDLLPAPAQVGTNPVLAILIGPLLVALGIGSLLLLGRYLRLVATMAKRLVPRRG